MKRLIFLLSTTLIFMACKNEAVSAVIDNEDVNIEFLDINSLVDELTNDTTITAAEKEDLLFIREEEKLAGDIYRKYYELYGLRPFGNIEQSELKHTAAIKYLLDQFNIEDPVKADGEFTNINLQDLYDQLIESGSQSVEMAISNGVLIEEKDIFDLREKISNTTNVDIVFVYKNLLRGSENHLRAFMRLVNNYGIEYEPQFLTMDEIKEIISSSSVGNGGKRYRGGR